MIKAPAYYLKGKMFRNQKLGQGCSNTGGDFNSDNLNNGYTDSLERP